MTHKGMTSWMRRRSPQRMAVAGDGGGEIPSGPSRRGGRKRGCGSEPNHTRASRRPIRVVECFTQWRRTEPRSHGGPDGSSVAPSTGLEEGRPAPREPSGRCPDLPNLPSDDDPEVGPHADEGGTEPQTVPDCSLQAGTGAVPNPLVDAPASLPQRRGLSPGPVSDPVQSSATTSTVDTATESDRALPQRWSRTGRTQCVPPWW